MTDALALPGPPWPEWFHDQVPAAIAAFAFTYQCPDCPSEVADIVQRPNGTWSVITRHAETCPDPTTSNMDAALMKRSTPNGH